MKKTKKEKPEKQEKKNVTGEMAAAIQALRDNKLRPEIIAAFESAHDELHRLLEYEKEIGGANGVLMQNRELRERVIRLNQDLRIVNLEYRKALGTSNQRVDALSAQREYWRKATETLANRVIENEQRRAEKDPKFAAFLLLLESGWNAALVAKKYPDVPVFDLAEYAAEYGYDLNVQLRDARAR